MIRILQVVTHMNRGGLETMIMNYYRNIDRNVIQFDFLVHREYEADYDQEIGLMGGEIYRISALNPFSISYRKELNRFFKEHPEYQIIHVHQDCLSSIILKAASKNGVRVRIAHSHNISQDKNLKYIIKMYYRQFIPKYATDLMACGKQAGEWMFSGANFQIVSNAINSTDYIYNQGIREKIRKKLNLKQDDLIIGHVGRFSPPKNHQFLVEVFYALCEKMNAKLLLVGDGDLKEFTVEQIERLNLNDKVIFTGVRTDVNELLQAMDVFVFPSIYEGLPVTMVEAQAAGLPCVISTNIPQECVLIPELVQRLNLTDAKEEWVNAILKLTTLKRKNTSESIKESGFDIKEAAKQLENFYIEKSIELSS